MNLQPGTDERGVWEVDHTYVIGHRRPDTDAIASALGYAWLLSSIGSERIIAARAGQLSAQTSFALRRFGCPVPQLLSGVAPLFEHITQPQTTLVRHAPLSEAMRIMAAGQRGVPVVDGEQKPLGVVTPMALARAYSNIVQNPQHVSTSLSAPCELVLESAPTFSGSSRISDHRHSLLREGADDFLVVDETGRYSGVATRSQVLDPPRARLILVDHNEIGQAVTGAEEAEILGVLDHHRLGNPSTASPIPFVVEPVGSTCTLVAERCHAHGLTPPRSLLGVLLSGILSDTLVFRSPTTTPRDRDMADWLGFLAEVEVASYGEELLHVTPGLMARSIAEIVDSDRKNYEMGGHAVSIGQVEVTNLRELPQRREELLEGLEERREREGLALICLMVTDVVTGTSSLLCQGEAPLLLALPFTRAGGGEWDLKGLVSRKKQLVPALSDVFESQAKV